MKLAVWAEWVSAFVTVVIVVLAVLVFAGCGKENQPGDPSKAFSASYLNVTVEGFAKGDGFPASEKEFHLAIVRGAEE